MKNDSTATPIIQNNQFNNYANVLPGFVKTIAYTILTFLVISEVFNFITLRGFENPLGYCLFKLIVYSICLLLTKFHDSSMTFALDSLKLSTDEIMQKLDEIVRQSIYLKKEENDL